MNSGHGSENMCSCMGAIGIRVADVVVCRLLIKNYVMYSVHKERMVDAI